MTNDVVSRGSAQSTRAASSRVAWDEEVEIGDVARVAAGPTYLPSYSIAHQVTLSAWDYVPTWNTTHASLIGRLSGLMGGCAVMQSCCGKTGIVGQWRHDWATAESPPRTTRHEESLELPFLSVDQTAVLLYEQEHKSR